MSDTAVTNVSFNHFSDQFIAQFAQGAINGFLCQSIQSIILIERTPSLFFTEKG